MEFLGLVNSDCSTRPSRSLRADKTVIDTGGIMSVAANGDGNLGSTVFPLHIPLDIWVFAADENK